MTSYELAKQIATTLIRGTNAAGAPLTRELIEEHVNTALKLNPVWVAEVDRLALVKDLETQCSVWMGTAQCLDNATGHVPWLPAKRGRIEWRYWQRYRQSLSWPIKSVDRLDELTDQVLERLEDPEREGRWDRRGLVVGHVQSGKTANFVGLINKAVDAGYRLIVVLSGIHKSLRSQTQIRLDEGFLGYESTSSANKEPIGVGTIDPSLRPNTITNRLDNGDFKKDVARNFAINPGKTEPLLFVVKKNKSVLENLVEWVEWAANAKDDTGRKYVKGIPLLVIDDEADHASVDTKQQAFNEKGEPDEEHNPTAINRLIRKLLRRFEKVAYVGYTATPFANIFIHESGSTAAEGKDLFPESFIVNLPTPTDYVGPLRVFGMEADEQSSLPAADPLPVFRTIDDHASSAKGDGDDDEKGQTGWMPPRHDKTHEPGDMPGSLEEAINAFVITCAARRARGQVRVHNSMLIHVTKFTYVQEQVKEQVDDHLRALKRRIKNGEGDVKGGQLAAMRRLWEDDFVPTTEKIEGRCDLTWEQVEAELWEAINAIGTRCVNGTAKDILDYETARATGVSLIAVGGDKLARGLTLEGLSVSYFLRASKMYDTLMQMGRWFGYRPGYLDLCRMYMTSDLYEWFQHITAANEELRQEFDRMVAVGGTPRDYGLRVKTHPALLITSPVKMRNGTDVDISFAGTMKETVNFSLKDAADNLRALTTFVDHLGPDKAEDRRATRVWKDISASFVCSFLDSIRTHPRATAVRAKFLSDFVRTSAGKGELVRWHVALVGRERGKRDGDLASASRHEWKFPSGPHPLVERTGQRFPGDPDTFFFKRVVNPTDETIDLDPAAYESALELTRKQRLEAQIPSGPSVRSVRPATRGLLLLYPFFPELSEPNADEPKGARVSAVPLVGFALSFPSESSGATVTYKVNNRYWEQEYGADA